MKQQVQRVWEKEQRSTFRIDLDRNLDPARFFTINNFDNGKQKKLEGPQRSKSVLSMCLLVRNGSTSSLLKKT